MTFSNEQLLDGLNSVTTIPLIPFRSGRIDFDAHAKNIAYLMENNHLSDGRPRVICVAGTSLIHHVSLDDQNKLIEVTGEVWGTVEFYYQRLSLIRYPKRNDLLSYSRE